MTVQADDFFVFLLYIYIYYIKKFEADDRF